MDLAQARSVLPSRADIRIETHQPTRDALALHALACWCLRYSPLVCADGDDGLMMDVHGTDAVHHSEKTLIGKVQSQLAKFGFVVRVAVASSFAGAWALARFGPSEKAPTTAENEQKTLMGLPIAALGAGVDADTIESLNAVGVERIGELAALPRSGLLARFDGALLRQLDYLTGRLIEPAIDPVVPEVPIEHAMVFDGPTTHVESIEVATGRVLDALIKKLKHQCKGVRRLRVTFSRPKVTVEPRPGESFYATSSAKQPPPDGFEIVLSRASANGKHLWKLIRTKFERIDMALGVEAVQMVVLRGVRMKHTQERIDVVGSTSESDMQGTGELVDALVARLGPHSVLRMQQEASHLPEHSFRYVHAIEADAQDGVSGVGASTHATNASTLPAPTRPSVLFDKPEVVEVMALTPDGPIMSLRWRSETHRIISCIGPERVSPEWWRWAGDPNKQTKVCQPPPSRDYFAVQTNEGRWVFLCRHVSEDGTTSIRWFVQGEWT